MCSTIRYPAPHGVGRAADTLARIVLSTASHRLVTSHTYSGDCLQHLGGQEGVLQAAGCNVAEGNQAPRPGRPSAVQHQCGSIDHTDLGRSHCGCETGVEEESSLGLLAASFPARVNCGLLEYVVCRSSARRCCQQQAHSSLPPRCRQSAAAGGSIHECRNRQHSVWSLSCGSSKQL